MVRVEDIMTRGVQTVTPDTSADRAWEQMRMHGVHHLVVTTDEGVAGLISARDIGGRSGGAIRAGRRVDELMASRPLIVRGGMPVRRAANLMRGHSVGSLVVCDEKDRLVGIVTVADLLALLGRGVTRPAATVARPVVNHRAPHRKRHSSAGAW